MSHFFAYLSRMKYIQRWGLMHNVHTENIQEHSLQVAMIAHNLAIVKNRLFEGELNADHIAMLALFHDSSEVITGDLPTPIKYYSPEIKDAYKSIEEVANRRLFELIPDAIKPDYEAIFFPKEADKENWKIIKAADKISAYLKCLEERKSGNQEFSRAEQMIHQNITDMKLPEVDWFLEHFVPSMKLTLDELD